MASKNPDTMVEEILGLLELLDTKLRGLIDENLRLQNQILEMTSTGED
jgi:hypothetical protein